MVNVLHLQIIHSEGKTCSPSRFISTGFKTYYFWQTRNCVYYKIDLFLAQTNPNIASNWIKVFKQNTAEHTWWKLSVPDRPLNYFKNLNVTSVISVFLFKTSVRYFSFHFAVSHCCRAFTVLLVRDNWIMLGLNCLSYVHVCNFLGVHFSGLRALTS